MKPAPNEEFCAVLRVINQRYRRRGNDSTVYLYEEDTVHLADFFGDILDNLENSKVIEVVAEPIGRGTPIEIAITDPRRFQKLCNTCDVLAVEKQKSETLRQAGLMLIVELHRSNGLIQWMSTDDRFIGQYEISSGFGRAIVSKLWGPKNRLTLQEGITQYWPNKAITIGGLVDELKATFPSTTTAIDTVNHSLRANGAPIFIKRSGGMVSIVKSSWQDKT